MKNIIGIIAFSLLAFSLSAQQKVALPSNVKLMVDNKETNKLPEGLVLIDHGISLDKSFKLVKSGPHLYEFTNKGTARMKNPLVVDISCNCSGGGTGCVPKPTDKTGRWPHAIVCDGCAQCSASVIVTTIYLT